ncbi:hypothetical protein [Microbulbifer sp. DLAB2-AA]|uniref:hypothetical protein n=1 Tax=Microbulbifer sp. DLAB2-AA TaxID=3243394 RepID=UPI00403941AF
MKNSRDTDNYCASRTFRAGYCSSQLTEQHTQLSVRLLANNTPIDLIELQVDIAIRLVSLDLQSTKVSDLGVLRESLNPNRE